MGYETFYDVKKEKDKSRLALTLWKTFELRGDSVAFK